MIDKLAEIYDTQNDIILLQAEVIKDLFSTLLQHITAAEADTLPAVEKINKAAELRKEIGLP